MHSHSKIAQNIIVLFMRQMVLWGINLVLVAFLPGGLGDVGLGQFTFATSLMLMFSAVITAGTSTYAIKQVAREPEKIGRYLANMLLLRFIFCLPVLAIIFMMMRISNYPDETRLVVYIVAVQTCIWTLNDAFVAILLGMENMQWQATAEIIGKLIITGATVYFIKQGHGVITYAVIVLVAAICSLAINAWPFFTRIKPAWQVDLTNIKILLLGGAPFLITGFFTVAYGQIDTTLLRLFTNDATVGWYGAAAQLLGTINFFPLILMRAMLPALSRMHVLSPEELRATARKAIELIILASVPLAFGIAVLAQDVIWMLHYPLAFDHSVPLMIILGFVVPVTGVLMVVGAIAAATDRQREWAMMMGVMTALLVGLDIVLIPLAERLYGNGAIGAATGPAISETLMLCIGIRALPVGFIGRDILNNLCRTLIAGMIMAVVIWLMRAGGIPLIIVVPAGALLYGCLTLLTGSVRWRELMALKTQLLQPGYSKPVTE